MIFERYLCKFRNIASYGTVKFLKFRYNEHQCVHSKKYNVHKLHKLKLIIMPDIQ